MKLLNTETPVTRNFIRQILLNAEDCYLHLRMSTQYSGVNKINWHFVYVWILERTRKIVYDSWDFKFSRRRVWCSELSSGLYCRVKWLSKIILHGSTTQKTALNVYDSFRFYLLALKMLILKNLTFHIQMQDPTRGFNRNITMENKFLFERHRHAKSQETSTFKRCGSYELNSNWIF
jgi:hypothetical protein